MYQSYQIDNEKNLLYGELNCLTLVQERFSINGKTNTGIAFRNLVTEGPESVIPAEAGIQVIELNNRITGFSLLLVPFNRFVILHFLLLLLSFNPKIFNVSFANRKRIRYPKSKRYCLLLTFRC